MSTVDTRTEDTITFLWVFEKNIDYNIDFIDACITSKYHLGKCFFY